MTGPTGETRVTVLCEAYESDEVGLIWCPTCRSHGPQHLPVTATLTGRDALVYEAGKAALEMLWVAGYRHDSPALEAKGTKFRLTDNEREWLRQRADAPPAEGDET